MDEIGLLAGRIRGSTTLPDLLDAGFYAFEAIRSAARDCEDRTPQLFAAFMMASGAATEGRNALTSAPSLPLALSRPSAGGRPVSASADVGSIADELAALAELLASRLPAAAAVTALPGDRAACHNAARAAAEIHELLAPSSDAAPAW